MRFFSPADRPDRITFKFIDRPRPVTYVNKMECQIKCKAVVRGRERAQATVPWVPFAFYGFLVFFLVFLVFFYFKGFFTVENAGPAKRAKLDFATNNETRPGRVFCVLISSRFSSAFEGPARRSPAGRPTAIQLWKSDWIAYTNRTELVRSYFIVDLELFIIEIKITAIIHTTGTGSPYVRFRAER